MVVKGVQLHKDMVLAVCGLFSVPLCLRRADNYPVPKEKTSFVALLTIPVLVKWDLAHPLQSCCTQSLKQGRENLASDPSTALSAMGRMFQCGSAHWDTQMSLLCLLLAEHLHGRSSSVRRCFCMGS